MFELFKCMNSIHTQRKGGTLRLYCENRSTAQFNRLFSNDKKITVVFELLLTLITIDYNAHHLIESINCEKLNETNFQFIHLYYSKIETKMQKKGKYSN